MLRQLLTPLILTALACSAPSLALAQGEAPTREDYESQRAHLLTTFDDGRGLLYLAPHSEARRVGDSVVLIRGRALWGHLRPGRGATLSVGAQSVSVAGPALIGLQRPDDAPDDALLDLYLGHALLPPHDVPLEVNARNHLSPSGPPRVQALPPISLAYGPAALRPLGDAPAHPSPLGGVLEIAQDGQREPLRVYADHVSFDVTPDGPAAELTLTLDFDLQGLDLPLERSLAILTARLPHDALLTSQRLTIDDASFEAERETTLPRSRDPNPPTPSIIRPADPLEGTLEPLFIPLTLRGNARTLRLTLELVAPLALDADGALLRWPTHHAPRSDDPATHLTLRVHADPDTGLRASLPLTPPSTPESPWVYDEPSAAIGAGFTLALPLHAQAWGGHAHGRDGSAFALHLPTAALPDDDARDVLILLDRSKSMEGAAHHAKDTIRGLAHALRPSDRLQILAFHDGARPLFPDFLTAERAQGALEEALASVTPRGGSGLTRALDAALALIDARATQRPVQLIYIGDAQSTDATPEATRAVVQALTEREVRALAIHIGAPSEAPWDIPIVQTLPGASGLISAARAAPLFGAPLRPRLTPVSGDEGALERLVLSAAPTGWSGRSRLLLGHHVTPQPFFDILSDARYCLSPDPEASACANSTLHVAPLTEAAPARSPGRLHVAHRLTEALASCPPDRRCEGALSNLAPELEALDVLGPMTRLQLPGLRPDFEVLYHERRSRLAPELTWMPPRALLEAPPAGRVTWPPQPALPAVSDARGSNSVALPAITVDEHIAILEQAAGRRRGEPSISSLLHGDGDPRQYQEARPAYADLEGEPREIGYAIQERLSPGVDQALRVARERVFWDLHANPAEQEAFLDAWQEVAIGNRDQLYAVSSRYYELGLYDKGRVADFHAQAADLVRYEESNQRKSIIAFYLEQRLYEHAERLITRGLELYPDDRYYFDQLSAVLQAQGEDERLLEIEIGNLRKQLSRRPDDSELVDALIIRLVKAGQGREAQRTLDDWKERLGTSPTYHRLSARLALAQGEEGRALERLLEGVRAFPDSRISHSTLVAHHAASGDLEAAARAADAWRARDPDNLYLLQYLGDLHTRRGDHGAALEAYTHIVEKAPDAAIGYIKRGDALAASDQTEEAAAAYHTALGLDPNSLPVILRFAETASSPEEYARAEAAFERIRLPQDPHMYDHISTEDELLYQLYTRWRSEALYRGEDEIAEEVLVKMRQKLSYVQYMFGHSPYALRAALVLNRSDPELRVDVRVDEPGPRGARLSYISPYNNNLGSQLLSSRGASGTSPRVYALPTPLEGDFTITITFEGPSPNTPMRGHLFLHKIPDGSTHIWERHEVFLEKPGDRFEIRFSLSDPPTAQASVPP